MKLKSTPLFIIGLIAALCIGFLIGISVDYPKTNKSDVAGTFGKVEKYRKVQMTEKDIQLRSELTRDTAKLRTMIQGLTTFSVFTDKVSKNIEASLIAFKSQGAGSQLGLDEKFRALQEYSDFIRNNNESLRATIMMLAEFYADKTADASVDVEKNLKDFGAYVNSLDQKNAVLTTALRGMDEFMISNKALHAHKAKLTELKSIRDQLLISGIQLSGLMCSHEQTNDLLNTLIGSQEQIAVLLGNDQLPFVSSNSGLKIFSKENLQMFCSTQEIKSLLNNQEAVTGLILLYDKSNLQFFSSEKMDLSSQSNLNLTGIAMVNGIELDIILGVPDALQLVAANFSSSDVLFLSGAFMAIMASDNLNTSFSASGGIIGIVRSLPADLGIIYVH